MSWFFKSSQTNDQDSSSSSVKDDLSVIGDTIGRQLRGVANFLAPPPRVSVSYDNKSSKPSDSSQSPSLQALVGIRNDLAEIGDNFKSGLSKFTSNFLQFKDNRGGDYDFNDDGGGGGGDDDDVAGINEEAIAFAEEISSRAECWIDFPLPLPNDFRMTGVQREHAMNIERIVPSLAELRNNIQSDMGGEQFWMVYFIFLIPRLNERDFEILLTPEILETRNVLLQRPQNKRNEKVESSMDSSYGSQRVNTTKEEVAGVVNATEGLNINDEEKTKRCFKEHVDNSTSMDSQKRLEDEDEVSFSDLEGDDSDFSTRLSASRKVQSVRAPSPSGSSDWIQLNENSDSQVGPHKARESFSRERDSDAESADWHNVDDFD